MTPSERQAERRAFWASVYLKQSDRTSIDAAKMIADSELAEYDNRFPITDPEPKQKDV
jgi:hypothetical protein